MIIGHSKTLTFLSNGIRSNRLNPSLIFSGPDGVGKKTVALQLAAHFFCEKNPSDINWDECACPACARVRSGTHADVLLINRVLQAQLIKEKAETQTAIKIDSLRHADKFLHLRPIEGARRVCIIEEADKMTDEAANSFLKMLEEPPLSSLIILLAISERNMLSTVLSRCSVLRFNPVGTADIARWLVETRKIPIDEAERAAAVSQGSFEKVLKALEETETLNLSDTPVDEFFTWLGESGWRKEGRQRAAKVLAVLIEDARQKLEKGDFAQRDRLQHLFTARRQLDRHVPPRLLLENLYLKCEPVFQKKR